MSARPDSALLDQANSIYKLLVKIRRDLHQIPERGFKEEKTSRYISAFLKEHGFFFKGKIAGTGITADLEVNKSFPTIALRADIDALPIEEQSEVPFRSRHEGRMHACGHDMHTACLLGALLLLKEHMPGLRVNVRAIFQPAEELIPGGAKALIEQGVLAEPDIRAIFGLHVDPFFPTGTISLKTGPMMASTSAFTITVKGRGGHAAAPYKTIDPIPITAQIISSLQTIISRMTNPFEPGVISITQMQAGTAYNIIPEKAVISGTARALDPDTAALIPEKMEQVINGIVKSYGADAEFVYTPGTSVLVNDEEMTGHVKKTGFSILGESCVLDYAGTFGGEDFADYLQVVPGCFFRLGCRNEKEEQNPLHNPSFNPDERALIYGAAMMAGIAVYF
ncbi:M20 family metallopeptidase [candidate division KSB1 bacterium]